MLLYLSFYFHCLPSEFHDFAGIPTVVQFIIICVQNNTKAKEREVKIISEPNKWVVAVGLTFSHGSCVFSNQSHYCMFLHHRLETDKSGLDLADTILTSHPQLRWWRNVSVTFGWSATNYLPVLLFHAAKMDSQTAWGYFRCKGIRWDGGAGRKLYLPANFQQKFTFCKFFIFVPTASSNGSFRLVFHADYNGDTFINDFDIFELCFFAMWVTVCAIKKRPIYAADTMPPKVDCVQAAHPFIPSPSVFVRVGLYWHCFHYM